MPRFLSRRNNIDFASCSTEPALCSTVIQELSKENELKIAKVRHKRPTQPIRSDGYFHHSPLFSETLIFGSPLRSPHDWRGGRKRRKVLFFWVNLSFQGSVLNCLLRFTFCDGTALQSHSVPLSLIYGRRS